MFNVVPVIHRLTATPATTEGIVSTTASDSRKDENSPPGAGKCNHRDDESKPKSAEHLVHRHVLPAHRYIHTGRRGACLGERPGYLVRDAAQILAGDIGLQRQHPLHVVPVVFAKDRSRRNIRDVPEIDLNVTTPTDGDVLDLLQRMHA
jgi:hypothetical protein